MKVFPIGNGAFVGKIEVSEDDLKAFGFKSKVATIVLLDRSESMGDWVPFITKTIFPELFTSLGYGKYDPVTILAFDNGCVAYNWAIVTADTCNLNVRGGGTELMPTLQILVSRLHFAWDRYTGVRILTISSGEVSDRSNALRQADMITEKFKNSLRINSQAVQLFTSLDGKPDTVALCSLLQLNNTKSPALINLYGKTYKEDISSIKEAMCNDGLEINLQMTSRLPIFKKQFWEKASDDFSLIKGENLIWLDPAQIENLTSGKLGIYLGNSSIPVKVEIEEKKDKVNDVMELLKNHFDRVYEYLKVLRIIGSVNSQKKMSIIVDAYKKLEAELKFSNETKNLKVLSDNKMAGRLNYLRQQISKRNTGFTFKMTAIENDNRIDKLNSSQKAEYLRSKEVSKPSHGVPRFADISELDFDKIAQKEAMAIAGHLKELTNEFDGSDHQSSFYSMETTLSGIKAVASLVNESYFHGLTANDILLILNIVGVACEAPVGDFPDPSNWSVNRIYPGVFVSVSDLMISRIKSGSSDAYLKVPGHDNLIINNVIPLFEDIKIINFLENYAPNLLSYSCSIGMRGKIENVPLTVNYTLGAGIWKLVECIATEHL